MQHISGVYLIKNIINGKFYIGSSKNIHKRFIQHICYLKKQKHHNSQLQRNFNKYGLQCFVHGVIEYCESGILQEREQYYLDTMFSDFCMNALKEAYSVNGVNHPMFGKSHTDESKAKIKDARSKQIIKHSPETKYKIGSGSRGKKRKPEHVEKSRIARIGIPAWNKGMPSLIPNKNKIIFTGCQSILIAIRYFNGESIEFLRRDLGVSWDVIKNLLLRLNIQTRSISKQKIIRDGKLQVTSI